MIDHETLLEYATEDASSLIWAVETLEEGPQEAASDLLLLALSSWTRTRDALTLALDRLSSDDEYKPYLARLRPLCERGQKRLPETIQSNARLFDRLFCEQEDFSALVSQAEALLNRFCAGVEDHELFSNDPDLPPELFDPGAGFLLVFSDLYRAATVSPSIAALLPSYGSWCESVFRLERLFKDRFGYFAALADTLVGMTDREYDLDVWWLRQPPLSDDTPSLALSDDQVRHLLQRISSTPRTPCPTTEQIVSYALGESFLEERQSVLAHLVNCPDCLRLVVDVQAAQQEADESDHGFLPLPPNIDAALGMPTAYSSYADFYRECKIIAPSMTISPEGRLADIPVQLLTADWRPLSHLRLAEAETPQVKGRLAYLAEGRIKRILPVSAKIQHKQKEGVGLKIRGVIEMDHPLPPEARLVAAMLLDEQTLVWPKPSPRWIPETGEFELRFTAKERLEEEELLFIVLVQTS